MSLKKISFCEFGSLITIFPISSIDLLENPLLTLFEFPTSPVGSISTSDAMTLAKWFKGNLYWTKFIDGTLTLIIGALTPIIWVLLIPFLYSLLTYSSAKIANCSISRGPEITTSETLSLQDIFFMVGIIELTKIPLASAVYYSRTFYIRTILIIPILGLLGKEF